MSKSGVGMSAGTRGARYSVHSSGRRTMTVGIPGTGISYSSTSGTGRRAATSKRPIPQPAPRAVAKPGLLAPRGEKALFKAWDDRNIAGLRIVSSEHPDYRVVADTLAALLALQADQQLSRSLLAQVFASGHDPAEHRFTAQYLSELGAEVPIAPAVTATEPIGRELVGLLLAELHQAAGDLDAAIDVVEQLEPTQTAAVSLAELYSEAGRHDDVVDLTNDMANTDDATALLCCLRGVAFRELGRYEAARESFKETLKSKKRDPAVRHRALFERAATYLREDRKAAARRDLERILAEDAAYDGVQEALQALDA